MRAVGTLDHEDKDRWGEGGTPIRDPFMGTWISAGPFQTLVVCEGVSVRVRVLCAHTKNNIF